jgi:hypothetical protein
MDIKDFGKSVWQEAYDYGLSRLEEKNAFCPNEISHAIEKAAFLRQCGQAQSAVQVLSTYEKQGFLQVDWLLEFGHSLLSLGQLENARRCYLRALSLDPHGQNVEKALQDMRLECRRLREAFLRFSPEKEKEPLPWITLILPLIATSSLQNFGLRDFVEENAGKIESLIIVYPEAEPLHHQLTNFFENWEGIPVHLLGVSGDCNNSAHLAQIAAKACLGDVLLMVSDRLRPAKGFLEAIARVYFHHTRPSAICGMTTSSSGQLLEAGFSFLDDGKLIGFAQGEKSEDPKFCYSHPIPSGSQYWMAISQSHWEKKGGFTGELAPILSLPAALVAFGRLLDEAGEPPRFAPYARMQLMEDSSTVSSSARFRETDKNRLQDFLSKPLVLDLKVATRFLKKNDKSLRVLVLGVYLANQLNAVDHIVHGFSSSSICQVTQSWAALFGPAPTDEVAKVTSHYSDVPVPKFELMNRMIEACPLSDFDYLVVADDDIIVPENFLDAFISIQRHCDFALAQPARTEHSYIDHPIVRRQRGVIARQTRFVEIGPVFSIHQSLFSTFLPFDLSCPMGWGYENVWARYLKEHQLKQGIVDATMVDHSLRKPVSNYSWQKTDWERNQYLAAHPHFTYDECFKVLEVIG